MDTPDDELIRWAELQPRNISEADLRRFEGWLREIFTALGMTANAPGIRSASGHRRVGLLARGGR